MIAQFSSTARTPTNAPVPLNEAKLDLSLSAKVALLACTKSRTTGLPWLALLCNKQLYKGLQGLCTHTLTRNRQRKLDTEQRLIFMFWLAMTHEKRNVSIPKHPAMTISLHTGKLSNSMTLLQPT